MSKAPDWLEALLAERDSLKADNETLREVLRAANAALDSSSALVRELEARLKEKEER